MLRLLPIPFLLGLILHLLGAWNSVGYHHADEHWQVMEFASYKMGFTPAEDLAWEFEAKIRPWLQPGLQVLIYKTAQALGVSSISMLTFLVRLFMSLLGFASVVALLAAVRDQFQSTRAWKLAVWTSMLFWFHPWFHARTSGEGLSAAFLLFAVAALLRHRPWIVGLCLGVAFQARYLMVLQVFAVLGMVWWGAQGWQAPKLRARFTAWGVAGFVAVLALGALVDRWGYGEWVFPAWRYVVVNGVQGKSHQFGVYPWWDYVLAGVVKMPPVLGAFAITVLITFWIGFWERTRAKRGMVRWLPHWLTWMTAVFIFVHMYIAHKELRFLYPLASFLPLMLAFWVQRLEPHWARWIRKHPAHEWLRRGGVVLLWGINIPYLLFGALAAERNPFRFQMYVADHFQNGLTLYSDGGSDIFYDCILPIHWGVPKDYRFVGGLKDEQVRRLVADAQPERPIWFFTDRLVPEQGIRADLESHCVREYSVIPSWLMRFNFGGWAERVRAWSLWKCDR